MSAGEITAVASVLFAILNPLTKLPLWLKFVNAYPQPLHRKMAGVTTAASLTAILVVLWFGVAVLEFLEVTIEGIQVAGGSVIILIGFSMVVGQQQADDDTDDTDDAAVDGAEASSAVEPSGSSWLTACVVPMAIPVVVGGGVIAVVATISANYNTSGDRFTISIIAAGLAMLTFVAYSYGAALARILGQAGLEIMTRIFGIILLALGFQITFGGLVVFFPGLAA